MPGDGGVDPRFDPRYQRGYDPARHPEPEPTGGADAVAGSATPVARVDAPVPTESGDDGIPAEWAEEPAAPEAIRRITPVGVVLIALGVVMIAAGVGILVVMTRLSFEFDPAAAAITSNLLLQDAPSPLIAVGCVGVVLGLAVLLLGPRASTS